MDTERRVSSAESFFDELNQILHEARMIASKLEKIVEKRDEMELQAKVQSEIADTQTEALKKTRKKKETFTVTRVVLTRMQESMGKEYEFDEESIKDTYSFIDNNVRRLEEKEAEYVAALEHTMQCLMNIHLAYEQLDRERGAIIEKTILQKKRLSTMINNPQYEEFVTDEINLQVESICKNEF